MKHFVRGLATCIIGILAAAFIIVKMSVPALAGDINGDEARIIDFYNQVFSYNGEKYVATEGAKASAYAKLVQDGVDLSGAEVDSYITQAWANIGNGIAQGYLVPYVESTEDTQTTEDGSTTEPSDAFDGMTEDVTEDGQDSTEDGTSTEDTQTTTEDGQNSTDIDMSTEDAHTTTELNSSEATTENQNNNEDNNGLDNNTTEDDQDTTQEVLDIDSVVDKLDDNKGVIYDSDGTEVSAESLKDALDKDRKVTIEQYGDGTVYIVDNKGNVIYKATLPVKNTGYKAVNIIIMISILAAGAVILGLVLKEIRRKPYFVAVITMGILIIAVAAYMAAGNHFIDVAADKWKSIWISGAPQYHYTESNDRIMEEDPLIGALYGELTCDTIGLRVPLYYGDDEKIFSKGAGTYAGAMLPGKNGTALIGAHDTTYFAPLENIKEGDVITVATSYGSYKYSVTGTQVANVSDKAAYNLSDDKDEIILYTCYPFGETGSSRLDRFYVYGERIKDKDGE